MPVRRIPKNYRNITGIAAHTKAEGEAGYESSLERDFLTLLEFDPDVLRFEVQPVTIMWTDGAGKSRRYTPDVLAHYDPNRHAMPMLYEVKYRSDLRKNWEQCRPSYKAAVRYSKERGWRFKLATDVEIRTVILSNAKFLLPFVRQGAQVESHMDMLYDTLTKLETSTPGKLVQTIFQDEWHQAELLPTLWYLIGTRQIYVDLNQPLSMNCPIKWSGR